MNQMIGPPACGRRYTSLGSLLVCIAASAGAFQSPDLLPATFRAGTRLVEVEVVVRDRSGPVTGLSKDDFTVFDRGKPQRIDVFRAGQLSGDVPAVPLAAGAVANRVNRLGEALPSATVVLFDQLNTRFDNKAYESKGMLNMMRGLGPRDRAAIYALGRDLHVLQDFTDDPGKLLAALSHVDSGRDLMPANVHDALFGFPVDMTGNIQGLDRGDDGTKAMYRGSIQASAELNARINAADNDQITVAALRRIVAHLSGMPGRRNLVWLMDQPMVLPAVMGMLLQAGIHLYPVLIRTEEFDVPDFLGTQKAGRDLAALTGGASFDDALDLQLALQTAQEDSQTAYTLGYYPSEDILDGQYHRITVNVAGEKANHLEIHYRPGYLATKVEAANGGLPQALAELFGNPLDNTGLGLTAWFEPEPRPGFYRVYVTVDLHDVHLERRGSRSVGRIELAFPFNTEIRVLTVGIDLTDAELADALNTGFEMLGWGVKASGDFIRVVVRDPTTGLAGSLRIPLGAG
jgi:VWFA-related protein